MSGPRHARGAALIIAISLLAALLFLALPFLFSQTASVAGSRAAAWDGVARRGSDRAMNLANAMAVYATGLHRSPGLASQLGMAQLAYVQLPQQIGDDIGAIRYPSFADNSWRSLLVTGETWALPDLAGPDSAAAVHGAVVEDESRRIDPNCLDMYGWAVVLKRAGIEDPWTVQWHWDLAKPNNGYWTKLTFGRLARALTYWRPSNGSQRYNRLEDLLGADPQQPESWYGVSSHLGCVHFGPMWNYPVRGQSGWPTPGQTVEDSASFGRDVAEVDPNVKYLDVNGNGVRDAGDSDDTVNMGWRVAPLTQAEMERLRPHLSFLVPGQGRSGLIDIGTVVAAENRSGDWWGVVTDELAPPDTGVVGGYVRIDRTWTRSRTAASRHLDNGWARAGDPLALDALPALNINTVPSSSGMTRLFLAQNYAASESDSDYQTRLEAYGWPQDPIDSPVTTLGGMPFLRWLDPRTGDGITTFERPPVGIAGFGIVAIEGLATARDQLGNAVGQRRRRIVAQAVPQERPVEAAWTSQGDFEALLRLRHGSWMVAGPHPTNRIADWGNDGGTRQAQDMQALDGPGWMEPAPLCSFGVKVSISGTNYSQQLMVPLDWRVPFGLTRAQPWADVLKPVDAAQVGNGTGPTDQPAQLRSSGTSVGALTAQGLRLRNGDVLAYTINDSAGPLRFGTGGDEHGEMRARHVSMRFSLPSLRSGDTVVLMESRSQVDGADSDAPDRPATPPGATFGVGDAASEQQNLWRVEYRDSDRMLVLVMANAALPWSAADRTRFGVGWSMPEDNDPDAVSDPRCGSTGSPFAPADPVANVEFRYKVPDGLSAGQWYHLQVYCASDRPGMHGLILDGVIGRDLTRPVSGAARLGDHYTFPCLRLAGEITTSPTAVQSAGGSALDASISVSVTYPADLSLSQLLPERGLVRIDDEYLSYAGISGSGGTGTLSGVRRARRIATNQAVPPIPPVPPSTTSTPQVALLYPLLQQHADGAIVTPGWTRIDGATGRWLRGYGMLKQDFQKDPQTGSGTLPASTFPATGGTITVVPTPPSTATWPEHGILALTYTRLPPNGGATVRAAFTRSGGPGSNVLELDWDDAGTDAVLDARPAFTDITGFDALLISMHIDGVVTNLDVDADGTDDIMWGAAAQLLDQSTGACEWVRIDGICDRGPTARFLVNTTGWNMVNGSTDYTTDPDPSAQPRGAMRTPQKTTAWAGTTRSILVLPVQHALSHRGRLESGDVMTAVPDTVVVGAKRHEPVQLVVRHAARDGYPAIADAGEAYEVDEGWFALTHRVPDALSDPTATTQTLIVGRGWCGDDLSVNGNQPMRRGSLPRKEHLGTTGTAARLFLGSTDPRTGSGQDVLIDDVSAGPLTGLSDGNDRSSGIGIVRILAAGGGDRLTSDDNDLPATVTAQNGIFAPVNGNDQYGLVQIDGEVFAYRRGASANQAVLIARGLLGSEKTAHALTIASGATATSVSGRTVAPWIPAVPIPMGPVAELCSPLPQGGYAAGTASAGFDVIEVAYANFYKDPLEFTTAQQESYADDPRLIMRSPFVLIHDPSDNAKIEITRLLNRPASTQRLTASWLRGLYGTTDQDWTSIPYDPGDRVGSWTPTDPGPQSVKTQNKGELNPIIIGWWPRYAPGLAASPTVEALRSRSFAWAGFALRLSGARFDPKNVPVLKQANGGLFDITVADDAGCDLTASALAAEEKTGEVFDWDKAYAEAVPLAANANTALAELFDWTRFDLREVDGAEVRVHWQADLPGSRLLERAADAAGRAPRLERVRLRCVAPARILAVEEVR